MSTARVLVVDDEPAVLKFVVMALLHHGYEVQGSSDPLQALKMAQDSSAFDLVLSDVIMPRMCGPELVRRIAAIHPTTAVVLMSANIACELLPENALFLGKPFGVADLYAAVETAVKRSARANAAPRDQV